MAYVNGTDYVKEILRALNLEHIKGVRSVDLRIPYNDVISIKIIKLVDGDEVEQVIELMEKHLEVK